MYYIYRCPHDIDNEVRLGRWVAFEAVFVPLESPPALYFYPPKKKTRKQTVSRVLS